MSKYCLKNDAMVVDILKVIQISYTFKGFE